MNIASTDPPLVSILIVTFTQHELLARCLDRIATATRDLDTETIVVVNGVPLQPEHRAAETQGATLLHAPVNLGMSGGLQYARAYARGRYLAIVQDDVEVDEHWLGPLVEALDDDPTVGAVGSRIADPDGQLCLDGMVVSRTAMSFVVEPAARPDSRWAVDACFSASCLLRADAWDSVGGPNPRLFPNQHVDVDFGLRLAEAGWSILVARDSVARHRFNSSTNSLLRNYLKAHNRRIVEREHRSALQDHPEHFLDDDDINTWLVHCAAGAERRRGAPAPERTARPPIPLDVLIHDARTDTRRVRVGAAILHIRLSIRYRSGALVRSLRRRQ